jgi:hypothetical protein
MKRIYGLFFLIASELYAGWCQSSSGTVFITKLNTVLEEIYSDHTDPFFKQPFDSYLKQSFRAEQSMTYYKSRYAAYRILLGTPYARSLIVRYELHAKRLEAGEINFELYFDIVHRNLTTALNSPTQKLLEARDVMDIISESTGKLLSAK